MSDRFPEWIADRSLLTRVARRLIRFGKQIGREIDEDEVLSLLLDHAPSIPRYVQPSLCSADPNARAKAIDRLAGICRQALLEQLRRDDGDPRHCLYRQLQRAISGKDGFVITTNTIATWYGLAEAPPSRYDNAAFEYARGGYAAWDSPRELVPPERLRHHWQADFRTLATLFSRETSRRIGVDLWIPLFALRDFVAENYSLALLYPGSAQVTLYEQTVIDEVITAYDLIVIDETLRKIERLRSAHALLTPGAISEWLYDELKTAPYLIDEILNRIEDPERGVS